jgi:hypothetical protein
MLLLKKLDEIDEVFREYVLKCKEWAKDGRDVRKHLSTLLAWCKVNGIGPPSVDTFNRLDYTQHFEMKGKGILQLSRETHQNKRHFNVTTVI